MTRRQRLVTIGALVGIALGLAFGFAVGGEGETPAWSVIGIAIGCGVGMAWGIVCSAQNSREPSGR